MALHRPIQSQEEEGLGVPLWQDGAPWSPQEVAARVRAAWDTLRRIPMRTQPMGFISSMPDVVRDAAEAYGYNKVRVTLAKALPGQVDRMEETIGWFVFLRDKPMRSKIVWLNCGAEMTLNRLARETGYHRQTLRQYRDDGLRIIAEALTLIGVQKKRP